MQTPSPPGEDPSRRDVLRAGATGVAGLTGARTTILNNSEKHVQDDKSETATYPTQTTQQLRLLPADVLGYNQQTTAENPTQLRFGWTTVRNEGVADLKATRRAAELSFSVAGESIPVEDGLWSVQPSYVTQDGRARLRWQHPLPTQEPGTYEFTTIVHFEQPHHSRQADGSTKTWTGTYQYDGSYTVVQGEDS